MAVNDSLHFRIEILHADRNSREAQLAQSRQLLACGMAGMHLNRGFKLLVGAGLEGQEFVFDEPPPPALGRGCAFQGILTAPSPRGVGVQSQGMAAVAKAGACCTGPPPRPGALVPQ